MDTFCSTDAGSLRLTCYLRAHGIATRPPGTGRDYNEAYILAKKREQQYRSGSGLTWPKIGEHVARLGKQMNISLECYLRDIWEVAKQVAPDTDLRGESAALLFTTSCKHKVVTSGDILHMKHLFGDINRSLLERAHQSVWKIVDLIGEEEVQALTGGIVNKQEESLPIFGSDIKLGPRCSLAVQMPNGDKLLDLHRPQQISNVSLDYNNFAPTKASHLSVAKSTKTWTAPKDLELCGREWLEIEIAKLFPDTTLFPELLEGTVSILSGSKTNEELQDELFELLGFERFSLIQFMLEHRARISQIKSVKDKKIVEFIADLEHRGVASMPIYGQQVTVMSETEKQLLKQVRKEEKKVLKAAAQALEDGVGERNINGFNPEELRNKREIALRQASDSYMINRAMQTPYVKEVQYPFVFDNYTKAKQSAGFISGLKMTLPLGFSRNNDNIKEEVCIPEADAAPLNVGNKLISIKELDQYGQAAFENCKSLNRIQTVVFDAAYHSNENLLICAPTGAGKTNIAMLTVVHQIRQHLENGLIQKDKFKIVYIAPMKALASEMTANFSKRLNLLGLSVRELTGDMHLTKPEIMATNMIITTPEKWDVTTRKPGDTQLSQLVKLLIIDEVHLLHGDRGPVLETIVARTLRMVESLQSMVRIVGLSATLPNYIDVARFLRVNPFKGLFFFDSRFRPVPLGLSFIGIKAHGRFQLMEDMDKVTFEKCLHFLDQGHQVMIFVHARNSTLRTAENLIRIAQEQNRSATFLPQESADITRARRDLSRSRNKQLAELFDNGFGVHHAGLLRSDRNTVEDLFSRGLIKVLVCTATLAWGVNLPAHAVIIKGTEIYDSKHGTMVDLGMLDVLQIFGRAGRPQFDKSGHGTIITTHDKLTHYLSLLTNQYPIESSFINHLADNLNAEITLGTVTNVDEAVEWLSYTYLYVRMRMNPQVYGLQYKEAQMDPNLELFRKEIIIKAAQALDKARMVRFDEITGYIHSTDLGRIASQFYVKYDTVIVFNELLQPLMDEGAMLSVVAQSSEFTQLKVRDEELDELDELHKNCEVIAKGGVENIHGKVNILLQSHISRLRVQGFSLVSDVNYIRDNSVRLTRALFEVVLHKGWPLMAARMLDLAKMLEKQMWGHESPLRQFSRLGFEIIDKIESRRLTVEKIRDMESKDVGRMLNHDRMGKEVKQAAWQFPMLEMEVNVQPITRTVLRVKLLIRPDFRWNDKVHGKQEIFWIWVEDPDNNFMYHHEQFCLTKKQVMLDETQELLFTIPIFDPMPSQYYVVANSDKWLGSKATCIINVTNIILPDSHPPHTDLLDLQPLPISALNDATLESLYSFTHFNPIQTQIFHCLYHSDCNVLLGAPTGSGKTIAAEIAMFRLFKEHPNMKVVYIAPMKALVRERVEDWRVRLGDRLGKTVVELTGDVTPDIKAIKSAHVIITTPEKWDGISRSWQNRDYVRKVGLIVIDEIHLLGEDRGPVLEVIVSRTNYITSATQRTVRIIGLSTAIANARDLADWLGIKEMGLFNFRSSVRPVPLEVHIAGFPGKHYCPRMATMNKPTFQAIKQHSPDKPVLVFVSSRRQTRLTALDLIGFVATEANSKQWLNMPEHEMEQLLRGVKEENLRLCLTFGVGLHHAGLVESDRKIVEELFVNLRIQILITTATLAWGVNFPAHLVVIKGTEFYDGKTRRYVDFPITDVLQMMGRAGRPQFDNEGIAVVLVQEQKKHFYKKFLYEPFPVESSLMQVLPDHLNAEVVAGTIKSKQEALDYLSFSYFFRRLDQNPTYYHLELGQDPKDKNAVHRFLSSIVDCAFTSLENADCVEIGEDNREVTATSLGRIGSFYYLKHETMLTFKNQLHAGITLEKMLMLLTEAREYAEFPVRHNEDLLNAELSTKCKLKVEASTYDSSHTKAFLLLQAHLSHLPLPCADYVTDTKTVLDQAIRILQALLDICASHGWLAGALQAQILMQMLTQACWHSESPLLTLSGVTRDNLYCFKNPNSGKMIDNLPELISISSGNQQLLSVMLNAEFDNRRIETIFRTLQQLPILDVIISLRSCEEAHQVDKRQSDYSCVVIGDKNYSDPSERKWYPVPMDEDCIVTVTLQRLNQTKDLRVHAPKFPKAKDESWFIVLGDAMSGELMAMKRVSNVRSRRMQNVLQFHSQAFVGRRVLTLFVMSDSYIGLDQQYDIPLQVVSSVSHTPLQSIPEQTDSTKSFSGIMADPYVPMWSELQGASESNVDNTKQEVKLEVNKEGDTETNSVNNSFAKEQRQQRNRRRN